MDIAPRLKRQRRDPHQLRTPPLAWRLTDGGPTARATLAWGNAPGNRTRKRCGLKAHAKRLIPHKPLIKTHPILGEHRPHLRLKIPLPMVLRLPIDIPHQRRPIAQPNRKRRIPTLPTKPRKLRTLRLDPLRRRNLQPLNNPSNRLSPPQKYRHMHMIGNPTDPHTNILRTVQNRRQISVHLHPYRITKQRATPLRAEHNMHQHLRDRLRHGGEFSVGLSSRNRQPLPTQRRCRQAGHRRGPSSRSSPSSTSCLPRRWLGLTRICHPLSKIASQRSPHILHTFVALVQDKPGVLTRVASLFRRLNLNIVSLTVGESERPDTSRMTIVCEAPERHAAHRIKASLYKLETTVDVDEVNRSEAVVRELCLIKVAAGPNTPQPPSAPHPAPNSLHSQIFELANVFRARVVDLAPESIMLEMTGSASKIEGLVQVLTRDPATPSSKSPAPAAWPCAAATTPPASSKPSAPTLATTTRPTNGPDFSPTPRRRNPA